MASIAGRIVDQVTGAPVEARVQVLSSQGRFLHPQDAILKVGPGVPFFYSDGAFQVDAPRGLTRVLVERGTEYIPAHLTVDTPSRGTVAVDVQLERWTTLGDRGWHPGNTHIHYDQHETRPDERLRLDPRIEDLRVTAISILRRWDLAYASNKYPVGVLTEFCSAHHHVECGEESRHNAPGDDQDKGYGHIMLLGIKDVVEPLSRGYLVDETDPDYPPLCYACDDAHRQGGLVIWCHNGRGLEVPVATALGKVDAFNLFDPYWMDPEYDVWYALLNCGFRLPASTGSDWFVSSGNRVYAYTGGAFDYGEWMQALARGRTFITNGPAVSLQVQGALPGDTLAVSPGGRVSALVEWESHYDVQRVELVWNGRVLASQCLPCGCTRGRFEADLPVLADGWFAARLASTTRDSFCQPIYAHTSPVYVDTGVAPAERVQAAAAFVRGIDDSLDLVQRQGRFHNEAQRREVRDLFRRGQQVLRRLTLSA